MILQHLAAGAVYHALTVLVPGGGEGLLPGGGGDGEMDVVTDERFAEIDGVADVGGGGADGFVAQLHFDLVVIHAVLPSECGAGTAHVVGGEFAPNDVADALLNHFAEAAYGVAVGGVVAA